MKWHIRLLALLFLLLLDSCSAKKKEAITFVARTYSNETTEIIDHVIFKILGKTQCYERPDVYELRTGIKFPEYDVESENKVTKQYMEDRRMINDETTIVVKNVIPWGYSDSSSVEYLKSSVDSVFRDDNTSTFDGKSEEFKLSKRQKNIYNILLDNVEVADLFVSEMANTGCLHLKKGTGKEQQVPVNARDAKPEQYLAGYLTVSKAVVSDDGKEACLYYEYVSGPKLGIGCIIFVEKTNNRWRLIREVMIWIS